MIYRSQTITMISSRLITTDKGFLSHTFIPENTRPMIERRIINNKRFGKLEITVPSIEQCFSNTDEGIVIPPRNLVIGFLLDVSGSMEGLKIQHAKNTIKKFVEVIHAERNGKTIQDQPFHAWIYVITFENDAQLVIPFQEITDETIPKILEQLEPIRARGSTNYEKAFQKQTEVVEDILAKLNELQQRPHYHFMRFFETDGEITQGSNNIEKLYAMMRNTTTHKAQAQAHDATTRITFEDCIIGYGTDIDLNCLKSLASPYPLTSAIPTVSNYNCSSIVTILKPEDIGWQVGEILFKIIMRYANKVEVSVSVVVTKTETESVTAGMLGRIEIFEYQTHQWGSSTILHSIIHGEKKTLWVQYSPSLIATTSSAAAEPVQIHVKLQYENQFTGKKFACTFEHEIPNNQSLDIDIPTTQPPALINQLGTTIFQKVISLVLGMTQIEIFKQFREIEAERYDKDMIVREAYKTKRMLNSIDAITRQSNSNITSQTMNLMTDVKVIIGLTTLSNPREQNLVLHARRICSAEQEVFNTGAEVSRKYVEYEEYYEEEAARVIQAAKEAREGRDDDYDNNDETDNDVILSRIPTMMPDTQDFETPFAPRAYNNQRRYNYNAGGSELRALCVKLAIARKKNDDISAEELYKHMCSRHYSYHNNNNQYELDYDAPRERDDTFSITPMNDEYTQRRIGMMQQMSS